jgi:hypothetical protein
VDSKHGQARVESSSLRFASFRTVKENPEGEIVTKILEPVWHLCFNKNEVAGTDGAAFVPAQEVAATSDDDINLIARMWSLQIRTTRCIKLDLQAGVFPEQKRSLLLFFREKFKGLAD